MELAAGTRVGPYEVVAPIGSGGMGVVYRARDPRLGRDVALKVLPPEFARDPDRLRRFEQEARAAGALNHPNIVAVFDVGAADGTPYVVSELLEGETLRERARGGIPARKAIEYAVQIASGLAAAHHKGIVHRDLKPENVFVTRDGRVKILDFGLAKLRPEASAAEQATATRNTEPGAVIGTAPYMSPEQVRGQPADHRSDIFALGAMLYEMVAGRAAFAGETAAEIMTSVLRTDPPSLCTPADRVPPVLDRVVRRCMEKKPGERFQSAEDVAFALQAISDAADTPALSIVPPRRRRGPAIAAAVVLAVAAVVAGALVSRRPAADGGGAIRSIAVLPLENLSRDPEQEYFADGMTDALIGDLAKIGALRVISRTSVMRFKGARKPLPEIARELNVDAVVEGSVLRSGDRVRITSQLIRGATDEHIWSQSYERDLRDVLALQAEVARAIAAEIKVALTPQERTRLTAARPVDPRVHEAYLRGRFHWARRSEPNLRKAIEYFQQAIRLDADYAPAHSGLADAYIALVFPVGALAPSEGFPQARAEVARALEIDDALPEGHASNAALKMMYQWDWTGAESEFRRSLELDPNYAHAHHYLSHLLLALGRIEGSLAESRKALDLDPLSANLNTHLGWHYLYARQTEAAIAQFRKTIDLEPGFFMANVFLSRCFEMQKDYDEAIAASRRAAETSPQNSLVLAPMASAFAHSGRRNEALAILKQLDEISRRRYVSAYEVAIVHLALGDRNRAFASLERAYKDRADDLIYLNVEPRLDPIRSDPRFTDLVRRMGLARR
jgi:serine/threonine-protein kinase